MEKDQLRQERDRLQAALDRYNEMEPTAGRHVGLIARIANLNRLLDRTHDA